MAQGPLRKRSPEAAPPPPRRTQIPPPANDNRKRRRAVAIGAAIGAVIAIVAIALWRNLA